MTSTSVEQNHPKSEPLDRAGVLDHVIRNIAQRIVADQKFDKNKVDSLLRLLEQMPEPKEITELKKRVESFQDELDHLDQFIKSQMGYVA